MPGKNNEEGIDLLNPSFDVSGVRLSETRADDENRSNGSAENTTDVTSEPENLKNGEIESVLQGRFSNIEFNFGRTGCHKFSWIPLLILTSLGLNIAAIFMPFMTIHPFAQDPGNLNIITLIQGMWGE